jgi:NO-binding membrane sensor protein with MHYT domain
MEHTLVGNYNILLVLLSIIVILLTSIAVFDVSARMFLASTLKRILWSIIGALIMGGGIWALHFIGILAYMLPDSLNFSLTTLVVSLGIIIVSSFISLFITSETRINTNHFIFGSVVMSISILGMHYFGMNAKHDCFHFR